MQILLVDARDDRRLRLSSELGQVGHDVASVSGPVEGVSRVISLDRVDGVLLGDAGSDPGDLITLLEEVFRRWPAAALASLPQGPGGLVIEEATLLSNESAASVHSWLLGLASKPRASREELPALSEDLPALPNLPNLPTVPVAESSLGDFDLSEIMAETPKLVTYRAFQKSVQRPVVLQLLRPEIRATEDGTTAFQDLVKAQAKLVHQNVAPVFEVSETEGHLFYTAEIIRGDDLDEMRFKQRRITDEQAVEIVRVAGAVMRFMREQGIAHRPLRTTDVHIDRTGQVMLANLAVPAGSPEANDTRGARDIKILTAALRDLVGNGEGAALLDEIDPETGVGITSWEGVEAACARKQAILQQARARSGGVSQASQWLRTSPAGWGGILGIAAVAILGLAAVLLFANRSPEVRAFDDVVRIPKGKLASPSGPVAAIPAFWLDAHETTIAEYAEFLAALEDDDPTAYDNARQPASKQGHQPAGWDQLHSSALKGGKYQGASIDMNHPVVLVDCWDAHAYAAWKGGRLPSAEEWALAAAGPSGSQRLYPWGDEPQGAAMNRAGADPFRRTAPVDAFPLDVTPEGVFGLGGNVEEWTATKKNHPTFPDRLLTVVAGPSFQSSEATPLRVQVLAREEQGTAGRGIRVAFDKQP